MPELPEVETVCRGLAPVLEGRRLTRVEPRRADLRVPFPPDLAHRLTGRRVERIARRAKYILLHMEDGAVAIAHLGMSGRMIITAPGANTPPGPHDHLVLAVDSGAEIRFHDPRRFGLFLLSSASDLAAHPLLQPLGPEPLSNAFNEVTLANTLAGRRTSLKAALLDQKTVAGIGNIYACEALFAARLSPRRQASTVGPVRAARLTRAIREVLLEAIEAGGSSLRDYRQVNGDLGYFQHRFRVYDRQGAPCPRDSCGGVVSRIVQNGRSTFFCGRCQR